MWAIAPRKVGRNFKRWATFDVNLFLIIKNKFTSKSNHQNAQKCAIFHSEVKKILASQTSSPVERGKHRNEAHSNQYNYRLLQSAKIAPRMHQNVLFFHPEVKKFSGKGAQPLRRRELKTRYWKSRYWNTQTLI